MNLSNTTQRIYLASASPRRHELLTQMGIAHDILIVPAPEGEDEPRLPAESPTDYVLRTAQDKADRAVSWIKQSNLPTRPILTADTTVSIDDEILAKPVSVDDATRILRHLSGKTHVVQTAVTLSVGSARYQRISTTEVTFSPLSDEDINTYCDTGEPWGKAGAYGIQGYASIFIEKINGSYSGVMGLPIYDTSQLLRTAGLWRA